VVAKIFFHHELGCFASELQEKKKERKEKERKVDTSKKKEEEYPVSKCERADNLDQSKPIPPKFLIKEMVGEKRNQRVHLPVASNSISKSQMGGIVTVRRVHWVQHCVHCAGRRDGHRIAIADERREGSQGGHSERDKSLPPPLS